MTIIFYNFTGGGSVPEPDYDSSATGNGIVQIVPDNLLANEGETIEITCFCSDPRFSITWNKIQGGKLPYNAQILQGGVILKISKVSADSAGTYECSISDPSSNAKVTSAQARISIANRKAPPSARIEPKRLDLAQGQQGSFRCIIEGAPGATWTKVGAEVLNSKSTQVRGPELYFYNVEVEDRGVYICGNFKLFWSFLARSGNVNKTTWLSIRFRLMFL